MAATGELTFSCRAGYYETRPMRMPTTVYIVQVTASDGAGRTVNQTINVTVHPHQ